MSSHNNIWPRSSLAYSSLVKSENVAKNVNNVFNVNEPCSNGSIISNERKGPRSDSRWIECWMSCAPTPTRDRWSICRYIERVSRWHNDVDSHAQAATPTQDYNIGADGAKHISEALRNCDTVTHLNLRVPHLKLHLLRDSILTDSDTDCCRATRLAMRECAISVRCCVSRPRSPRSISMYEQLSSQSSKISRIEASLTHSH